MKLPDLKKWVNCEKIEGLLFFAQALDEMLFHHSLDSFKAPALNVHTNLLELRFFAIEQLRGTVISKNSFSHVIEELHSNLSNDPVIKIGEGTIFHELFRKINESSNPRQFYESVQALLAEFEFSYWQNLKSFILHAVYDGKKKDAIWKAAKSFCAEVELRGFSREYIYRKTQDFFFSKNSEPSTISASEQLEDFLNIFEQKKKDWVVFLRARLPILRYTGHLEKQKIFLSDGPMDELEAHKTARLLKIEREGFVGYGTYVKMEDVKSLDPISARDYAESKLRMFFNAYNFLDHKTKINIHPSCIVVVNGDEPKEIFLRAKPHPMERASSHKEVPLKELSHYFDSLFRNFSPEATHQLFRVFDYHSSAIASENPESQLISLWAALEGLFPPPSSGGRGIKYYLNLTLPSLVLTYPEKIFRYIEDALQHSRKDVRDIIERNGKGENFFEKTVYYLVAEETKEKATELTNQLGLYPLLRNRCYWCHTHFNSAKSTLKTIDDHRTRLSWHLRRIYLARNQILHNDKVLPYLPTLVENLHSYVDILLKAIISLAGRSVMHDMTIPTAFELLASHEATFIGALKKTDESCNSENFKRIIFGQHNPLSPFCKMAQPDA